MTRHTYTTRLTWQGSTGAGYRVYSREHRVAAPPAIEDVVLSADPAFRGDADLANPEQLLVMAASSCQLLSFLAVAARAGIDVTGYGDDARGVMDEADPPVRVGRIELAPVIRVAPGTDHDEVRRLVHVAHGQCYIANSLTSVVTVEATVVDG